MNKERLDNLVDILSAEYEKGENTIAVRIQQELFKHLDNPQTWAIMQDAESKAFAEDVRSIASDVLRKINSKTEKAILLSYREVAKDAIEVSEREIRVKELPKYVESDITSALRWNAERAAELANAGIEAKTRYVRIISQTAKADKLYDAVKKQMPKGIANGVKIAYKGGRQMSWRGYMEMAIRTTLSAESSEMQAEAGGRAGIVFYACDSFADCAPDHAELQGKVYWNERASIPADVMAFIRSKGMRSMQSVMESNPWLTTRPNCRHNFHAVPTEDVMSKSEKDIVREGGYEFGEYDKRNYELLQRQRYNERQIRKWKLRSEGASKVNGETSTRIMSPERMKADGKVAEWQKTQRALIKANKGVLSRDYARENAKLMAEDVGVKYDYKVVDGELEKK